MPLDMRSELVRSRQDTALAMRERGETYASIRDAVGYASIGSAQYAVKVAAARKAKASKVSTRFFGIEIEFTGVARTEVEEYLRLNAPNVVAEVEGYGHAVVPHWKLITDSSVTDSADDYGSEAVSPILSGTAGFNQVRAVMEAITACGGRVDRSCGMHVHHDARDLSPVHLATLVRLYVDNQSAIDGLVAPARRASTSPQWCGPVSEYEKTRICEVLADETSSRDDRNYNLRRFDRYRTLNVTSYAKYGSIEFRQHQGTLNPEKAFAWIQFGQAMVTGAMVLGSQPVPIFPTAAALVDWLADNAALPASVADYLKTRAQRYASRMPNRGAAADDVVTHHCAGCGRFGYRIPRRYYTCAACGHQNYVTREGN